MDSETVNMVAKVHDFMGKISIVLESLNRGVSSHSQEFQKSIISTSTDMMEMRIEMRNIAEKIAHIDMDKWEKLERQLDACLNERTKFYRERKYLYAAIGLIVSMLGIITKAVWSVKLLTMW